MKILRKRLRSPSPESDGASELVLNPVPLSVPEVNASSPTPGSPLLNSDTVEINNNEPSSLEKQSEKPQKKKYRATDRQSTKADGILTLMQDDSAHREEHERHIQSTLAEFVKENSS